MANCGDSRAIVFGDQGSIILESKDHKPDREDERNRIVNKFNARVKRSADDDEGPFRVYA